MAFKRSGVQVPYPPLWHKHLAERELNIPVCVGQIGPQPLRSAEVFRREGRTACPIVKKIRRIDSTNSRAGKATNGTFHRYPVPLNLGKHSCLRSASVREVAGS